MRQVGGDHPAMHTDRLLAVVCGKPLEKGRFNGASLCIQAMPTLVHRYWKEKEKNALFAEDTGDNRSETL